MGIRYATGKVVRVVDGDTVHTDLDIGWGIILHPRIGKEPNFGTLRICYPDGSGWDAPEAGTPAGREATAYAMQHVKPGDALPVVSHGLATDGRRTLASVTWLDGRDWATTMMQAGYVK
jgi:endonuclease YncB( thermonuclease family)